MKFFGSKKADKDVPATAQYVITYDLNGGSLDGHTGKINKTYDEGTVITLPLPLREGYTFYFWKGSRYKAGQKYKVEGNHTFVARWKKGSKNSSGSGKSGASSKGSRTGDDTDMQMFFLMMIGALLIITVILWRRRRGLKD